MTFCQWLSKKTGKTYRLPTEAEWEYAARAGGTTAFVFGTDKAKAGEYAWFADNADGETHPVAAKKPNAWGLYDMAGNVREWVHDFYADKYDAAVAANPKGPATGRRDDDAPAVTEGRLHLVVEALGQAPAWRRDGRPPPRYVCFLFLSSGMSSSRERPPLFTRTRANPRLRDLLEDFPVLALPFHPRAARARRNFVPSVRDVISCDDLLRRLLRHGRPHLVAGAGGRRGRRARAGSRGSP